MKSLFCLAIMFVAFSLSAQQTKDRASMIEYENKFYSKIKSGLTDTKSSKPKRKAFKMDQSGVEAPGFEDFQTTWCQKPISQGRTGTCWCFSTTSFYESEVKRISGKEVDLSELYLVYFEYIEKAREFIQTRGKSFFGEGSETNALARMMKMHGLMPADQYSGNALNTKYHDHKAMFNEMKSYLHSLKQSNAWNEAAAIENIKSILDHYLGAPPQRVKVDGDTYYSPTGYMREYLKIKPEDYVNFMSLLEKPYYQKAEYDVPDNWWNSTDYNNVPLDDFLSGIKGAIKSGYTISIGGDVSEAGYNAYNDLAVVPSFDIPSDYIDENARQMRFSNGATTDDHAIHLIGWAEKEGDTWFLVKDSGSGARNGKLEGYYRYHEDYVKLKIMTYTVHKDAVEKILKKVSSFK